MLICSYLVIKERLRRKLPCQVPFHNQGLIRPLRMPTLPSVTGPWNPGLLSEVQVALRNSGHTAKRLPRDRILTLRLKVSWRGVICRRRMILSRISMALWQAWIWTITAHGKHLAMLHAGKHMAFDAPLFVYQDHRYLWLDSLFFDFDFSSCYIRFLSSVWMKKFSRPVSNCAWILHRALFLLPSSALDMCTRFFHHSVSCVLVSLPLLSMFLFCVFRLVNKRQYLNTMAISTCIFLPVSFIIVPSLRHPTFVQGIFMIRTNTVVLKQDHLVPGIRFVINDKAVQTIVNYEGSGRENKTLVHGQATKNLI